MQARDCRSRVSPGPLHSFCAQIREGPGDAGRLLVQDPLMYRDILGTDLGEAAVWPAWSEPPGIYGCKEGQPPSQA